VKIKYDEAVMQTIALFESLTQVPAKDTIIDGQTALFIVNEGDVGKAVGKNGAHVRHLERLLKKRVKIVGFSEDAVHFVRNMIEPLKASDIQQDGNIVVIKGPDTHTKGLLIGRDRQNLKNLMNVVKRHFDIAEIKVV